MSITKKKDNGNNARRGGTISDQIFFLGRHILLLVGRLAHASTPEQIVELRKQNEVEKVCRLTVFITSGEKVLGT